MDIEQARATALERRQASPEAFESELEALFTNPYFGDMVTEVFPEALDVHSPDGRRILKKYSDVAQFLEETRDVDDARFVALRIETEKASWDGRHQKQQLRAVAVRWYEGLRVEDFEAVHDKEGNPLGIAITSSAEVRTAGWSEEAISGQQPYAIVDSVTSALRFAPWSRKPNELSTAGEFVFGANDTEVFGKINHVDAAYGLGLQSLRGVVLNLRRDMLTK